jgi:uncharacterized membrane protein YsdA (DUF1294 family)
VIENNKERSCVGVCVFFFMNINKYSAAEKAKRIPTFLPIAAAMLPSLLFTDGGYLGISQWLSNTL